MMLLHRFASVMAWLFHRDRAERRLDDEIQSFIDMSAADKMRDGLPSAEARRRAILELGGVEQAKERVRTSRHGAGLDEVGRDVRYAFRTFVRDRSFTVVVVLTLALGIGANTAIFSIIDSLLLRTLPVKEPERLAMLVADGQSGQTTWTYPIWEQIQGHADRFEGTFAWSTFDAQFNLAQGGEAQFVNGLFVSGGALDTLGVAAVLGRTFTPADDVRGGGASGPVAVISHAFWKRHFGGAPDVIGRTLTLERIPFTVIGVTERSFFGLNVGRSVRCRHPVRHRAPRPRRGGVAAGSARFMVVDSDGAPQSRADLRSGVDGAAHAAAPNSRSHAPGTAGGSGRVPSTNPSRSPRRPLADRDCAISIAAP